MLTADCMIGTNAISGCGSPNTSPNGVLTVTDGSIKSLTATGGRVAIGPGRYSRIELSGTTELTLRPGVYHLDGPLKLSGSASLAGSGVTIRWTCTSSCTGGGVELSGSSLVTITAPVSGMPVLERPGALRVGGTAGYRGGTIHAPTAVVSLAGSGTITVNSGILVASAIDAGGNSKTVVNAN